MAVSLKDISAKVNVNTCSVSQVLNNHPRAKSLRPETREKILAAARELGYFKNEMAASVAKKHSNVLALISADMGSVEYTGRIQNGVLEAAAAHNYLVMLHRLDASSPEETMQKILGWRAAGVIFHVAELEAVQTVTGMLDKNNIPWGTVNLSNPGGIGFTSNDFAGIEGLVQVFKEKGHQNIAYLTLSEGFLEFRQKRKAGYLSGIEKYYAGKMPLIFQPEMSEFFSGKFLPEFLQKIVEQKIDAVLCESDHIAAALIQCAAAAGLRVPEAFSVAGFGNSVISEYTYPTLTTVAQDFENMGAMMLHQLIDRIEKNHPQKDKEQFLPVKIILRDSVKRV